MMTTTAHPFPAWMRTSTTGYKYMNPHVFMQGGEKRQTLRISRMGSYCFNNKRKKAVPFASKGVLKTIERLL